MGRLQRVKVDLNAAYTLTAEEKKTASVAERLASRVVEDLGDGASTVDVPPTDGSFPISNKFYIDRTGAVSMQIGAALKAPDGRWLRSTVAVLVKPVNRGGYSVEFAKKDLTIESDSAEDIERAVAPIAEFIENDIRTQGRRR